jgi:hypothetical protein
MVTESDLKGMSHEDLIELAVQKDAMVRSLEAKIQEMTQENESKIAKNEEEESQLAEHKDEEKMKEDDKEEKLAEKKDEEKMKEEDKEEKKKEHYKMSESLPSVELLSEIQALREQVQNLQKEKLDAERREAVGSLLREGKVSPSEENAVNKAFDLKVQGDDTFWNMFSERPINSVVPMTQIGHGASGQEITKESINQKIKELAKDKGLTYSQALSEFRSSNTQEYLKAYGV